MHVSLLTTPEATSSLCAVAADFTNALVAAAIALAASKICSSNANDSSAC
jgi:H+/gluconate symporter-like permease